MNSIRYAMMNGLAGQSKPPFASKAAIGLVLSFQFVLVNIGLNTGQFCAGGAPGLVEFQVGNDSRRGVPIMDFSSEMIVLGRDGQLHTLTGREKANVREVDSKYEPATIVEMRNRLRSEFGRDFEVLSTSHFLVVQPRGRGQRWPDLFERCHRSFVSYMSRRGIKIRRGRFPMVAVVMPDSAAMYDELRRMDIRASRVAGIYARESNRVITHDGGHTQFIAATVRHEAAHQSAYNYNVHSRVVITPRWVTEGIGQMFEPESMIDGGSGMTYRDRVNLDSLNRLRSNFKIAGRHKAGRNASQQDFAAAIRDLVGSNGMFENSKTTSDAYAVAWAMMYYLAERKPQQFAAVLSGTSRRGTYQPYDRFARLSDFERWVESDIDSFAAKVEWFLKSL